ncbi:MAG: insulinase family protein [Candidatus Riflebacteria bacterium]|nr:insulinase family protein [Candidatus Riflebacteria bacterium]
MSRPMLLAVALVLSCLATRPVLAAEAQVPKIDFEKYTLPNGLDVILHVDRKLPVVHVNLWFHVGSKNERAGKTGFAHLFEHMMFQGSKNSPGNYLTQAEKVGANLAQGGVNGTTDTDRTNYFMTAPSGALERMLWLESDRITGLLDAMTKAKLDNQRDVVKNERRQGLENTPYGRSYELVPENLFPPGHPYSWTVIGSHEDLTAATLDDVKEFFKTYYTPNNLTLVVAGDFDRGRAKAWIQTYFGSIPPGPALARPARMPVTLDESKLVVVADRVPLGRTYLVWPGVPYFDPAEADLDLASLILADGLSSRLQKALIYDKQLCSAIESQDSTMEIAGTFVVQATARPGVALEQIEQVVDAEIHRLAADGPTAGELERAKNKLEYAFVTGLERIGGFGGKADRLALYNTYLGRPDMFDADVARYRAVTAQSLKASLTRYVDGKKRLTVRFVPERSSRPPEVALDRSKTPNLAPDRPFKTPEVKTRSLANGLELFVIERPDLPKVSVDFVVKTGSCREPADKAGLSLLTVQMMNKGTKGRKALEIEETLASLGTRIEHTNGVEGSFLAVNVLKRNWKAAMEVLADVVQHPTFPPEELERERKKALDDLLQSQQDPNRIASRVLRGLVFGVDHPYGHSVLGTEQTLKAITAQDIMDLYKRFYVPSNAALVMTGDVTLEEAEQVARELFGSFSGAPVEPLAVPPPTPAAPGTIYLVDRQDAAQSVVGLILPGTPRSAPDYHALQIVDTIWGGTFSARLNLNLRENKGYTYGVFSRPTFLSKAGSWQAAGGVQTKVTREAVAEFVKETRGIHGGHPITTQEWSTRRPSGSAATPSRSRSWRTWPRRWRCSGCSTAP